MRGSKWRLKIDSTQRLEVRNSSNQSPSLTGHQLNGNPTQRVTDVFAILTGAKIEGGAEAPNRAKVGRVVSSLCISARFLPIYLTEPESFASPHRSLVEISTNTITCNLRWISRMATTSRTDYLIERWNMWLKANISVLCFLISRLIIHVYGCKFAPPLTYSEFVKKMCQILRKISVHLKTLKGKAVVTWPGNHKPDANTYHSSCEQEYQVCSLPCLQVMVVWDDAAAAKLKYSMADGHTEYLMASPFE